MVSFAIEFDRKVITLESLRRPSPSEMRRNRSPDRLRNRSPNRVRRRSPPSFHRGGRSGRRSRSRSPRRRRGRRSKTPPEDKFKGSLSEGLALNKEESSDDE